MEALLISKRLPIPLCCFLLGCFVGVFVHAELPPAAPATLFDPARHMRVSEVKPGMTGYGLSVFQGTKIERFDVEVVSILHDFNPKHDVVLIRCHGANIEHTGPIAGMSGSPIYLRDSAGKDRMLGAFAYGWQLQKDPIAGVQPIEYMLDLAGQSPLPQDKPAATSSRNWSVDEVVLLPGMESAPAKYPLEKLGDFSPNPRLLSAGIENLRLQSLATPLMISGVPTHLIQEMEPLLRAYGLMPLQTGGGVSSTARSGTIEPGSVLAVPLLEGDVDMSAVGACTERIGDQVFGFGHPFLNEGSTALPMSGGDIQGVVANYMTSFKLGSPAAASGTLTTDQAVGIAGRIGATPPMVPIDLNVKYADGSSDQHYHFSCALHPKITPVASSIAVASALSGEKELPQYHTLDYDLTLEFANGKTIHAVNSVVNATAADVFFELGTPIIAAAENPFERVMPKRISGTMLVTPEARAADILYANVPRSRYRPGESVNGYVTYRPFRSAEKVLAVSLDLPRDIPDGTYQLTISDWQKYLETSRTAEPFKFTAENIDQVFDVLRDVSAVAHKAVYVRLLREPDGIAIGHTAMPKLPSSRREVMIGAGRSDTTEFISSSLKIVPTDWVMSGSCDFDITVDRNADTDLSNSNRPPRRDVRPAGKTGAETPAKTGGKEDEPTPKDGPQP